MEDKSPPEEGRESDPAPAPRADSPRARQLARAAARKALAEGEAESAPIPVPAAPLPRAAAPARRHGRHVVQFLSFLLVVVLPLTASAWYLYQVALDQYASHVGFSVRKEETVSPLDSLAGISGLGGPTSNDTDILFEFIQSQDLVGAIDARLDLRSLYSRPEDPVFSVPEDVRIEGLTRYWARMTDVFYDRSSGLIEIRVRAFDPQGAKAIADEISAQSSRMINDLSAVAREDATRYAREELDRSIERLKAARTAITAFRSRTRIVDPLADIQGRMGLLNTLQAQLAEALIQLDLLQQAAVSDSDPRIVQAQRRVEVIEERITAERARFSEQSDAQDESDDAYSLLVSEYEALSVDLEFAENSYVSALAAYDAASAKAQRQSLYLATYIRPTLAQTAEYPRRPVILATLGGALFIMWSIAMMSYYSFRDRR